MNSIYVWLSSQQRSIFVIKVTLPDSSLVGIAFEHRTIKEAGTEEALFSKLMGRTVLDVTEVRYTLCTLYRLMPDGAGKFTATPMAASKARCAPCDNFNKELGRKLAITRLLAKHYPGADENPELTTDAIRYNKEIRSEIWKAYHTRWMEQVVRSLDKIMEAPAIAQGPFLLGPAPEQAVAPI